MFWFFGIGKERHKLVKIFLAQSAQIDNTQQKTAHVLMNKFIGVLSF